MGVTRGSGALLTSTVTPYVRDRPSYIFWSLRRFLYHLLDQYAFTRDNVYSLEAPTTLPYRC